MSLASAARVLGDAIVASAVIRILDDAMRAFGRIDILVNGADTCIHAPALDVTPED
jgi:NAD(P)-dependent dehydrogenase (short-subunit alcohol dehydrogenase family)